MSEHQREIAFEALANHPDIKTTFHVNDNDRIDQINILAASLEVSVRGILDSMWSNELDSSIV